MIFPGSQGGPHENIIAAKAIAFLEAFSDDFREYAHQTVKNARVLANTLIDNGIKLATNGTDNHLILIDLLGFGIGIGKEVATALEEAGIICNANTIPYDPSTPFKPSGLRLGTPMLTARGMKESQMKKIGEFIASVIKNPTDEKLKQSIKEEVEIMCGQFPIDLD